MADHVELRLIGLEDAKVALDAWTDELQADARAALEQLGQDTVRELQAAAPIGNYWTAINLTGGQAGVKRQAGALRRSIVAQLDPSAPAQVRIRAKAKHAHLVEFGHAGPHPAPPHPWFLPIILRRRREFARQLAGIVERRSLSALGSGSPSVTGDANR